MMLTPPALSGCPGCRAPLESSLACLCCGAILDEPPGATHLQRLGLTSIVDLALDDLERRYLRLSRTLHPDFHGRAGEAERDRALRNSARLNEAYATLVDDQERSEYLLQLHEPSALERHKTLPPEFLMEAMERSEEVDEARRRDDQATLQRLAADARAAIARRMEEVERAWHTPAPDTGVLARLLHEARVHRRILRDTGLAA